MAFNQNDNSFEVQLATRMQLILDQPMSDISTGLVNRDYEGDFFKIGNTVSVVKPDINSVNVQVGASLDVDSRRTDNAANRTFTYASGHVLPEDGGISNNTVDDPANYALNTQTPNDARLKVRDLTFSKQTLVIDKAAKYAFAISDITEVEGKWNYESGALDLAAQRMRKAHNIETMNTLLAGGTGSVVAVQNADGVDAIFGTAASPIIISSADQLYEDVILEMYARLYDKGAITADGQYTFGSNPQEGKKTYANIYMPTKLYTMLLKSKYFTNRSTVAADEKVETGIIKTITNLDVAIEPALVTGANDLKHVVVSGAENGTYCIIAGTANTVTRAGKVLPPDKIRSMTRFADEYHGLEIYGEKVFSPESAVVAFIKLGK